MIPDATQREKKEKVIEEFPSKIPFHHDTRE